MANNILIDQGSTTTLGTDDCAGTHISLCKLVDATEDSTTRTGVAANPLQVSIANTGANATAVKVDGSAVTQPVSLASVPSHAVTNAGTFAVQVSSIAAGTNNIGDVDVLSCALPTGASTEATLSTLNGKVTACNTGAVVVSSGTITAVTGITNALPAGNNNIGDVDVASLPALAAGTNLIGRVSSSDETSTIYNGTTAITPKFAVLDAASSGDNTLIAAVASKKIRVLSLFLVSAGAVNVRFESGASGTALTGQMNLVANTGFVLPYNPLGWFETASNTLLNLELSAAISVDGSIVYAEV